MSSRLRSQKWIVSAALISSVVSCGDPPANTDDVVEDDDPRPPDAAPVDAVGSEPDAPIPPDGTVVIVPATPRTLDDLTAQVTSDEPAAFTLRWFENGVERTDLTTDTVGNPETTKADVWRVELVRDGGEVASSFEVTIANTPPTAPVVAVPETAATTADIPCSIIEPATDADGDAIVYSASWTVNAAAYLGATASTSFDADTVLAEGTALDDQFVCTVTASDGADSSTGMSEVCEVVCGEVSIATTFTFTGTEQTVVVPECATSMVIEAWGAQGGGPGGGNGGYARGTSTTITEGDTFYVYVGGREGYNGGGTAHAASPAHGGGASDVRSVAGDLASRLIVAGGGGGGAATDVGLRLGGTGGGGTCGANYCGGGGGTGYGGNGLGGDLAGGAGNTSCHSGGAGGGGAESGGAPSCNTCYSSTCGTSGTLGEGGDGDTWENGICFTSYGGTTGGGGGYYGGGGTSVGNCGGGAGGGGSSWTGTLTDVTLTGGVRAGNGEVVITFH
jgi:hypothetical protein